MTDGLEHEWRRLRRRSAGLPKGRPPGGSSRATLVGRVVDDGAMPTTVPAVYSVLPERYVADREEGAAATAAIGTATEPVLALGPTVPGVGSLLVAKRVEGLWVAEDGGCCGTPSLPCAPCSLPRTDLAMAVSYYKFVSGAAVLTLADTVTAHYAERCFRATGSGGLDAWFEPYWWTGCVLLENEVQNNFGTLIDGGSGYVRFVVGCNKGSPNGQIFGVQYSAPGSSSHWEAACANALVLNTPPTCDAYQFTGPDPGEPFGGADGRSGFKVDETASCSPLDVTLRAPARSGLHPRILNLTE